MVVFTVNKRRRDNVDSRLWRTIGGIFLVAGLVCTVFSLVTSSRSSIRYLRSYTTDDIDSISSSRRVESQQQQEQRPQRQQHYLEELLYKYGSDKSRDDHAYSNLYQMIFDPIRSSVKNITEVGISAGQSLQVWYHFFPNAMIYGYDVQQEESIPGIVEQLKDRVNYTLVDLLSVPKDEMWTKVGLRNESMDVLIDDATHDPILQEDMLIHLWQLVRPGGYYIIEDIATFDDSWDKFHTQPDKLKPEAYEIITNQGDTMFVQTAIGVRPTAFQKWKKFMQWKVGGTISHQRHNSHMLVIQKRSKPLPDKEQVNFFSTAMIPRKVVLD